MPNEGLTTETDALKPSFFSDEEIKEKFDILDAQPNAGNLEKKKIVFNELLNATEDPQAQLLSLIEIIKYPSLITKYYSQLDDLQKINFSLIQDEIRVGSGQLQDIEKGIDLLCSEYRKNLPAEEARIKEINIEVNELLVDIKKGLLNSTTIPDEYKKHIISGLAYPLVGDCYQELILRERAQYFDQQIDGVLSNLYNFSDIPQELKRAITETTKERLLSDPWALEIVPLEDYPEMGFETEEVFAAAFSSCLTTGDYVESTLSPLFFPDEDPKEVKDAWECLTQPSWSPYNQERRVYFDPLSVKSGMIKKAYFEEFLDHANELIPLVNLLAQYGFGFDPGIREGSLYTFKPEYITNLIKLSKDIPALQKDLEKLKNFYPNFTYEYKTGREFVGLNKIWRDVIVDNPYLLAFEQFVIFRGEKSTKEIFEEGLKILKMIPKRAPQWGDSYVRKLVDWSCGWMLSGYWYLKVDEEENKRVVKVLNNLITHPVISQDTLEVVGSSFYYNSLQPKLENAQFTFNFLTNHEESISPKEHKEGISTHDLLWFDFVWEVGDIYRYDLSGGDIDSKKEMMKKDLNLALLASKKISNPQTKDVALEHLIYAYTDADYCNLEIASDLVETLADPTIKENAQVEIAMEKERIEKGLTTSWKKTEKVRRHAEENIQILVDVACFSTKEAEENARNRYHQKTGKFAPFVMTYGNPEEKVAELEKEIKRIRPDLGITINLSWENLLRTLESGRLQSIWENPDEVKHRSDISKCDYGIARDRTERLLGNRAKGGASDPHPIYGAAFSPNGRDEFFGAAFPYGECFIKLKNDKIYERAIFTYDDSFDGFTDFPFLWEQAATAKAMLNLIKHQISHGYAEAQVLGGVALEDIESISIPKLVLQQVLMKDGQSGVGAVLDQINKIREHYPMIKVKIIEEADALKMLELLSSYFHLPGPYLEELKVYYSKIASFNLEENVEMRGGTI